MNVHEINLAMVTTPADLVPSIWSDDLKMVAMFAPFRSKNLNSVGWESKMNFWVDLILQWCEANNRYAFSLRDLKKAFVRNNKTPYCLETVIQYMLEDGSIKNINELRYNVDTSWLNWTVSYAVRPACWAVNKLLASIRDPLEIDDDTVLVYFTTLKRLAMDLFYSIKDDHKIGFFSDLLKLETKYDNVTLLMNWFISQKLAVLSKDGSVYKLAVNTRSKVTPLTDGEISLLKLTYAKKQLDYEMVKLNESILDAKKTVKRFMSYDNKVMALYHLKQKKRYEARLSKITNNADNLIQLSESIRQAHSDADILTAYNNGLRGLKSTMNADGLNEDNVFDTMNDLKDALEEFSNIQTALAQPITLSDEDLDLEAELNSIIAEDKDNIGGNQSNEAVVDEAVEDEAAGDEAAGYESVGDEAAGYEDVSDEDDSDEADEIAVKQSEDPKKDKKKTAVSLG